MEIRRIGPCDFEEDMFRLVFVDLSGDEIRSLPLLYWRLSPHAMMRHNIRKGEQGAHLVRLAREENSTTSDTQSALLLFALLVYLRDGPSLDVIGFDFVRCGSNAVRWVDVSTDRPWWLDVMQIHD